MNAELTTVRCLACDHPIGSFKIREPKSLMTRCGRCKMLQHRHLS